MLVIRIFNSLKSTYEKKGRDSSISNTFLISILGSMLLSFFLLGLVDFYCEDIIKEVYLSNVIGVFMYLYIVSA